jgi:hypothetical protein
MSGWKARIGYLSPSVFETPSELGSDPSKGIYHRLLRTERPIPY